MDSTIPEIQTVEQLRKQLDGFIHDEQLPTEKSSLISLAYKYVVPRPQRTFRSNRWGRMLNESQKQSRVAKRSHSSDHKGSEETPQTRLKPTPITFTPECPSEKHQSDRGIYTIHHQSSTHLSTPPIKLKRPPIVLTETNIIDDSKRSKTERTDL